MTEELKYPWDNCKGYKVYHKKEGRFMMYTIRPDGSSLVSRTK